MGKQVVPTVAADAVVMQAKGWTQAQAAERFGIAQSRVSDLPPVYLLKARTSASRSMPTISALPGAFAEIANSKVAVAVQMGKCANMPWGIPLLDKDTMPGKR